MKHPYLEQNDGNIELGFEFQDIQERMIKLKIREKLNQPSKVLNILAPIGIGSEQPAAFPMYFLYDFDFVRLNQSEIELSIDQRNYKIDPFPVPFPFNGWRRNFARYSMNSQIIDFFVSNQKVGQIRLNPDLVYQEGAAEYQFRGEASGLTLVQIDMELKPSVALKFEPPLPMHLMNRSGTIKLEAAEAMGNLTGEYECQVNGECLDLTVTFNGGWTGRPETMLEKMILGKRSIFAKWPKQYTYQSRISFAKQKVQSRWINQLD